MTDNADDPEIIDVTPEPAEGPDGKEAKTSRKPEKTITDSKSKQTGERDKKTTQEKSDGPVTKKRGRGSLLLTFLIIVVAVFGSAVYFADEIRTVLGLSDEPAKVPAAPPPISAPDQALIDRISRIEGRVQSLQNAPPLAVAPAPVDVSALETGLADLSQDINNVRSQTQSDIAALADRIGGLEQAVGELASRPAGTANNDALEAELRSVREQLARLELREPPNQIDAMTPMSIAAIARLRQAVERGTGFQPALDGVEKLLIARGTIPLATGDALDKLSSKAKTGVSSQARLEKDFAAIAGNIIAQDALPEDANWWDRTVATVTGSVSIRQTGEIEGNSTEARVARAEMALSAGDLDKALDEISAIEGRGAKAAAEWLVEAQKRAEALSALDKLEAFLLDGTG